MLLLVAVDHFRLVDGILVVRDSTERRIWYSSQEFQARSSFKRKYKT